MAIRGIIRTGDIKAMRGLVDHIADGEIFIDKAENGGRDRIPCRIGYYEETDADGSDILRAAYLFIDDGITDNGNHYYKETINLEDNYDYMVNDEEA